MSRPSPTAKVSPHRVQVQVPATSANLGPGFDSLGVALGLHDLVTVEVDGPQDAGVSIEVTGEGADDVPRDSSHLVHRAMVHGLREMEVPAPGVRMRCRNSIPHGRGLGSSSAAIVAGLVAARALVPDGAQRLTDERLFAVAAQLEGHPDNVAPAVFGGFTVAYQGPRGFEAVRLDVHPAVSFVAFVPDLVLETRVARGLLPAQVSHADAAHNAGRAALLVAAMTSRPERLFDATEDRLHQEYRAGVMPESADLVESLRADGIAAVVSGAGPTVLALVEPAAVSAACRHSPRGWRSTELPVDPYGARLL